MNINSSLKKTPIAVIGLSAMFADAGNVEEFWNNVLQGKDSIKDVPASRWLIEDYYDEDMSAPDKTYCKRGGFLPNIDFNPMEFGLPPITNKPAAVRLFLTGADPKRATMRCCNKRKTTIPMTFASGYQKPSYPSMRRFA